MTFKKQLLKIYLRNIIQARSHLELTFLIIKRDIKTMKYLINAYLELRDDYLK